MAYTFEKQKQNRTSKKQERLHQVTPHNTQAVLRADSGSEAEQVSLEVFGVSHISHRAAGLTPAFHATEAVSLPQLGKISVKDSWTPTFQWLDGSSNHQQPPKPLV